MNNQRPRQNNHRYAAYPPGTSANARRRNNARAKAWKKSSGLVKLMKETQGISTFSGHSNIGTGMSIYCLFEFTCITLIFFSFVLCIVYQSDEPQERRCVEGFRPPLVDTFENVDEFHHLPKPHDWHKYSSFQKRKYLQKQEIDRVLAENPDYSIETSALPLNWDTLSKNARRKFAGKLERRKEVLLSRVVRRDAKADMREKLKAEDINLKSIPKHQRKKLLRQFERDQITGSTTDPREFINNAPTTSK